MNDLLEKTCGKNRLCGDGGSAWTPRASRGNGRPQNWSWRTPLLMAVTAIVSIGLTVASLRPELVRIPESVKGIASDVKNIAMNPSAITTTGAMKPAIETPHASPGIQQANYLQQERAPRYGNEPEHEERFGTPPMTEREWQQAFAADTAWRMSHMPPVPQSCN